MMKSMSSMAAGMSIMAARRLPVWEEMSPASQGTTEPPKPAVNRIQRESAVR